MELIYRNEYGACYWIHNAPNPNCKLQLVVDTIGLFMSESDLSNLLKIVQNSHEPCNCGECKGKPCNKIWTSNSLIDISLKVDEAILKLMEDLILGTQFTINMTATLEKHKIK